MKAKVKAKKAAPKRATKRVPAPVKVSRRGRSSTSRISSKHQVTIPVEVLRLSNFAIGDDVEFELRDDGAIAIKKVAPVNLFEEIADEVGDLFKGFDWEKERAEAWD